MTSSSFCDTCGAALPASATQCPFCGQVVQDPPRVYFAQTTPPPSKPRIHRHNVLMQRYRILDKIGEGGFGLVYKANDKKNNMIVAIKQINVAALSMQEIIDATDSYNREITLLPKLQHRSIPRLYGYFTDEDHWYIIMEYINGETLEEKLAKTATGRLPIKQVLDIGMALCDVLAYIHAQQPSIIYRDVKPSNIMITGTGDIYLIDFGTARRYRADQQRDTGSLGSPGYAAPEQYGKAQTTPKTDMYGLGATLQTLLTGKEPLEVATGGIPPDCDIPTDLQRLIKYMMSRDANSRPYDMLIVGQTLADIKKRISGTPGLFASSFTWLAALWVLFILIMANIFLSSSIFEMGTFYLIAILCAIAGMIIHSIRKAKKIAKVKFTLKEMFEITNEGISRALGAFFVIIIWSAVYTILPALFHLQIIRLAILIGFFIIGIGVMIAILKGLPRLLKWMKQKKAAQQTQQPTQMPPLQQHMH